jgi:hypothetical protein
MLLHGQRIIRTAFYRCIVGDDHALNVIDTTHSCDNSSCGHVVIVYAVGRQFADLEKCRIFVDQDIDSIARQEFAANKVALTRAGRAAGQYLLADFTQIFSQRHVRGRVLLKVLRIAIDLGFNYWH